MVLKVFTKKTAVAVSLVSCISFILFRSFDNHVGVNRIALTSPSTSCAVAPTEEILQPSFEWQKISPSAALVWHDCYSGFQCARLIVPLNYSDPNGGKAAIAIIRKPSPLPTNSPDYRGPILFNPGGPGGSGVQTVLSRGNMFSAILGPSFDILGFDPRGVGDSTPQVSFFKTAVEREVWDDNRLRVIVDQNKSIAHTWARAHVKNQLAEENSMGYLRHINTDHTARDMLTIVEAHGRKKLQYWGFSYGSVLGATFASMFPDKIERLVIDGVVDSENYFATLWSNNLLDTDKTMESFYTECANAGPERCAFHAPTPQDIAKNLTALYESIRARPIPVRTANAYGVVDYDRLRITVFSSLYSPFASFPRLAQGLADLAAGNGSALFQIIENKPFKCPCEPSAHPSPYLRDAQAAILCNDGKDVSSSLESSQKYYDMLSDISQWAEIWAGIRLSCSRWPKLPKTHFQGPFEGNTSYPILLIGNTADPVTPLAGAKKMSKGFTNSVVLTQDSPGHCSLAAPSVCTQMHVRQYFMDGTLPPAGKVCPTVGRPFSPSQITLDGHTQAILVDELTGADGPLLQAVHDLAKSYALPLPL